MRTTFLRTCMAAFAGLALAAGCSDDPSPKEQFCNDRDDLNASVRELTDAARSLDPQRTREAANKVQDEIDRVQSSAQAIDAPTVTTVRSAYDTVRASVQALSTSTAGNLAANFQQLARDVGELATSFEAFADSYRCD